MTDARIILWGTDIAAVSWDDSREAAVFQYDPDFLNSQIEISPIHLPLRSGTFQFTALPKETFRGLPGLLSDCLPDKFGNQLIDAWLVRQGRSLDSFNPVERLCYLGSRGMGALEFKPTLSTATNAGDELQIDELVRLANQVVAERSELQGSLTGTDEDAETLQDILRVGTSAGGARAKAILAWNEATGEFRSGQVDATNGFAPWILKFDGIHNNRDKELADPKGYGRVEYAYHLMALDAGIEMSRCRVHEENGRAHFMTRRFDRDENNRKLHMASLCGLMHYDFHMAGSYSYEQAIQTMQTLGLPRHDLDQQIRRATFNVMARNQDDHVKNVAFLMDRSGTWRLSPAYDVTYSYNPDGPWTSQHQMTLNGKRDDFKMEDLVTFANFAGTKSRRAKSIIDEVRDAVSQWTDYAEQADVPPQDAARIGSVHRLEW